MMTLGIARPELPLQPGAPKPCVRLLVGNRHREGDFFYREQIEALTDRGVIQCLDTGFSRDGGPQRHITKRLVARGAQLLEWLERGAVLYVCGRVSTLGRSFDQALQQILEQHGDSADQARTQLDQWSRSGVIRRDLFG